MHCILIYCCFLADFIEKQIINDRYLIFIISNIKKHKNELLQDCTMLSASEPAWQDIEFSFKC